MKKQTINCGIPATLSFSQKEQDENERFTRGQLRVFFKGETPDHRLFTDTFSEEVIKSLPYTPIVSYYDKEKDDFVGHATEQAIYGIVDPCTEVRFEEGEDGNTWAVCDTIYYTKRPGEVGEIAQKIEGHSQSLELDPTTVEYVVNYDERKHFKNIEFTAGHFVGVSVLGKDQKPAFTGSAFFASSELFETMKILRDYCEKADQKDGGNEMNLSEFIKLSWGETAQKVGEAIEKEYGREYYSYIVEMYEDRAIVRFYSYIDGSSKLVRINYSLDEQGQITLNEIHEVHVVYEDVPEVNPTDESKGVTNPEQESTENSFDNGKNEKAEEDTKENEEDDEENEKDSFTDQTSAENEDQSKSSPTELSIEKTVSETDAAQPAANESATFAAQDVDANTQTTMEVGAVDEPKQEETSSSTSLTDSERAEFEALKREKKEELLNSYKDYLSEDEYDGFFATIDSTSQEELESSLLKSYKAFKEKEEAKPISPIFSLSQLIGIKNKKTNENKESELANYIQEVLDR